MNEPIKSLEDLVLRVPAEWTKCPIGVAWSADEYQKIMRISLHEEGDGRRVLLIHREPIKVIT